MEKHCDNCIHLTSARLCMENEENPWCDNFEEYSNKTNWTPLTSQEQLDKVWDSMEVGSMIVFRHKKHINIVEVVIKGFVDSECGLRIDKIFNYAYTILTPYTGENV